jgi:hypothetical protein
MGMARHIINPVYQISPILKSAGLCRAPKGEGRKGKSGGSSSPAKMKKVFLLEGQYHSFSPCSFLPFFPLAF